MECCIKCGKPLPENTAFCVACGTRVTPLTAAPFMPPARTEKSANTFLNTGLGFVLMGALLLLIIGTGLFLSNFYDSRNLINVFRQFAVFASISFSAALTVRAKGPDLSIGSVVGLSAVLIAWFSVMTGSVYTGLIIALIISSIIGLINGVCAVYLRVPAIVISIVTGSIATGIGYLLSNGQPIMGSFTDFAVLTAGGVPLGALILLCITFIPAFLLVLLTRLGIPTYKRDPAARPFSYVAAYIVSSAIASLAGFFLLSRLGSALPAIGTGYELYILFAFASIYMSRALDNRIAPVLFAMVPACIWCLLSNMLDLFSVSSFYHIFITGIITLLFVVLAFVCRYEKRPQPGSMPRL